MKFGWTQGIPGKLNVTGRRIDADAPPLRFETNQTNDAHSTGFLASYLVFSTPGCWEVNAQVGDRLDAIHRSSLTRFADKLVVVRRCLFWGLQELAA